MLFRSVLNKKGMKNDAIIVFFNLVYLKGHNFIHTLNYYFIKYNNTSTKNDTNHLLLIIYYDRVKLGLDI